MCTNDKKLLKYELNLKLNDPVMPIDVDKTSPEAIARKAHIEKFGQTEEQKEEAKRYVEEDNEISKKKKITDKALVEKLEKE